MTLLEYDTAWITKQLLSNVHLSGTATRVGTRCKEIVG